MSALALPAVQPSSVPGLYTASRPPSQRPRAQQVAIGKLALRSLRDELVPYPKPGLVSPHDNGSHRDMTAATLMRRLFALRHAFVAFAQAGMDGASFPQLRRLGIEAGARMLHATRHCGAAQAVPTNKACLG